MMPNSVTKAATALPRSSSRTSAKTDIESQYTLCVRGALGWGAEARHGGEPQAGAAVLRAARDLRGRALPDGAARGALRARPPRLQHRDADAALLRLLRGVREALARVPPDAGA